MRWRTVALFLGLVFGYISIAISAPQNDPFTAANQDAKENESRTKVNKDTFTKALETTSKHLTEDSVKQSNNEFETPYKSVNLALETTENSESDLQPAMEDGAILREGASVTVDEKTSTVKPATEVTTELKPAAADSDTLPSASSTPITITITRPTKKPKPVKPAAAVTTASKPAAADSATPSTVSSSPITISITRPTKKPTKKPKPVRATTVKPLQQTPSTPTVTLASVPSTSSTPTRRYPCHCGRGMCSCCTGMILENFNVPFRSRACANVTYEPDDFAFDLKLLYNDRVLYNTRMSGKNPPPACIPINRYFGIKMCAKMTNVFMSGRNVHACLEMEGFFDGESAWNYSFNCFRVGSNGVAVVRPEDGGGLPPPPDEEEQTNEDYDDSARGWVGDVEAVPN